MMNITNPIYNEFLKLKLINKKNIIKICDSIRDKKMKVFKDKKSRVIFLEKSIANQKYYSSFNKHFDTYATKTKVNLSGNKVIRTQGLDNDERRYSNLKHFFLNKSVLDFGCCWGGFLNLLKNYSKSCSGFEIRQDCLQYVKKKYKKIDIENNLDKFKKKFDVVTLFHVLEHLPNQVETLKNIRNKIKKKGKIIVEVPSAQDFLISIDELPEFKKFTFWSEHLVLHTEKSLKKVLMSSGFKKIKIKYIQRYGYANHLGWFLNKKPGGHEYFKKYSDKKTEDNYIQSLIEKKQTDTLIAIGEN